MQHEEGEGSEVTLARLLPAPHCPALFPLNIKHFCLLWGPAANFWLISRGKRCARGKMRGRGKRGEVAEEEG